MINILEKEFGFQIIEIKKLNGYENENYLIETIKNKYIFKKYPYSFELESIIKSENEVLLFLSDNNNQFPIPIKTIDGVYVKIHEIAHQFCHIIFQHAAPLQGK